MPRRIRVQGCSGSGKSTLAAAIAQRLDLPHLELDAVNHREGWRPATDEEFDTCLARFLDGAPDGWVVCGNYTGRTARLGAEADTVVWLDLPQWEVHRDPGSRPHWVRLRSPREVRRWLEHVAR